MTGKRWHGVDPYTWALLTNCAFDARELSGWEGELMPVDPELLELYVDTITIEPFLGSNFENVKSYGAPVPYRAKIDAKTEEVVRDTGDVVKSTHSVAMDDVYPIDPRSRINMPVRFQITNPEIRAVMEWTDEIGPHHTTIKVAAREGGKA